MIDGNKKTDKIHDALATAKQAAEIGKVLAPGKVGGAIDKGEQIIDIADQGVSIFSRLSSLFKKKKR